MFDQEGITFDDIVLVPAKSDVLPEEVDTRTRISRNIELNVPLISAAMDTVTEAGLAIALAQQGGIGIIHKNLSPDEQAREVFKVKRSESGVIRDPITLEPDQKISQAQSIMDKHNISGIPIVTGGGRLRGILTHRDLRFHQDGEQAVSEVMTEEELVTAPPDTTLDEAKAKLFEEKVEKLLLIDDDQQLKGLITIKDIRKLEEYPNACKDDRGRLRVGAAIGVNDYERAERLLESDVDLVVVDTAHGHSSGVMETVSTLKDRFDVQVIAGNVATETGARDLIEAGADGIKVGIGPGAICTTRVIAGVGVPQITAVRNVNRACAPAGVPLIADGGITHSGDITKAIAVGADAIMAGSLFAGVKESPGERILYKGRAYKVYRGMGSLGAMVKGSKDRYRQQNTEEGKDLIPEGVEGRVPYKGPLDELVYQLVGGLRAGMGYCGAEDLSALQENAEFMRVTSAANRESHPHDITITREAPNYSPEMTEEE